MQINLTRAQLEAARTKLQAQGVSIVGDKTEVSQDGVTLALDYQEPVLNITVVKRPFYVPESTVESHINGWFSQRPALS